MTSFRTARRLPSLVHRWKAVSASVLGVAWLLSAGALQAEEELPHPLKPMLWKVEGGTLRKPSYLFGTIHLGTPPLDTLHPAAEEAFTSSEVLYTEIPMDAATQLGAASLMMRKDGKTLSQSIGPELSGQVAVELKQISPVLDLTPFESFQTWVIPVILPLLPSQLKGEKALDSQLWERATAEGKKTAALEKVSDQLAVFSDYTEAEQQIFLSETLRMMREERKTAQSAFGNLLAAYLAGDADKVAAEVRKSLEALRDSEHRELGERFFKRLLTERDRTMAEEIDRILQAEPGTVHFFAVGAGHYVGDQGIRFHLTQKGYVVTRISE